MPWKGSRYRRARKRECRLCEVHVYIADLGLDTARSVPLSEYSLARRPMGNDGEIHPLGAGVMVLK
jgi:hypothetical protein